jgi:hypothetical protein
LENKLEKPPLYSGSHQTNFVILNLSIEEADSIIDVLLEAEALSIQGDGSPTANTNNYVHLVNQWSNYRDSLE